MDRGGGLGRTFRIFAAHVQTRTQFAAPGQFSLKEFDSCCAEF